jgi:hypothetical protein
VWDSARAADIEVGGRLELNNTVTLCKVFMHGDVFLVGLTLGKAGRYRAVIVRNT